MKIREAIRQSGPAVIVAAVVLGPGSIVTSSQVGASYGFGALGIILFAGFLMFGMVSLASRLGVVYEDSLCAELTNRLGRWVAVATGLIIFTLIALFQSSNNVAMVAGVEALLFNDESKGSWLSKFGTKAAFLVAINALVITSFFLSHDLYGKVERLMKVLILLLVAAFAANFLAAIFLPVEAATVEIPTGKVSILPLLGLVGTTFSVAGAFYQAYLVREKGWTLAEWEKGRTDARIGAIVLVGATALVLATSAHVFHGRGPIKFESAVDVARQLEPLFGPWARVVFAIGLLAGATSSFLVNAIIGGTILSDSIDRGSRLSELWPRLLTTMAMLIGMTVALVSMAKEDSTVRLITFAQALTVLGIPVLALALVYLGTRPDLTGVRKTPRWMITTAWVGVIAAFALAAKTAHALATS